MSSGTSLDACRQMLDQVEHRLLRPVDVLEHEHERLQVGELDRPRLRGPRDLGGRALATDRVEHARGEGEQVGDRLVAAARAQLLGRLVDRVVVRDPRRDSSPSRPRPSR